MKKLQPFSPGTQFGRLTIVEHLGVIGKQRKYRATCSCGTEKIVRHDHLLSGTTTSCGCLMKEACGNRFRTHGQGGRKRTQLYRMWEGMKERTQNSRASNPHASYHRQGITVCPEWMASFETFRDYVEANLDACPPGWSVDRIDNTRGYEPDNIRWASDTTQMRNRSVNLMITVNGVTRCAAEWAEILGAHRDVVYNRIKQGWTPERAATEPVAFKKKTLDRKFASQSI